MKKQWFESWFESDLYDLMYQHRDDKEASAFITKLLDVLSPDPEANFLDLACGTGRHARFIHEQGYQVTGIDLSNRKISIASKFQSDKLEFFIQDMRKPFRINYFDFVLNLFTSFGYFDNIQDNLKVIKSVKSGLIENGIFVIDYLNAQYTIDRLVSREEKQFANWHVIINKDIEDGRLVKTMNWSNGTLQRTYDEKVTLFSLHQFESMLSKYNFKIVNIFGDYELNAYDEQTSPRLILICAC